MAVREDGPEDRLDELARYAEALAKRATFGEEIGLACGIDARQAELLFLHEERADERPPLREEVEQRVVDRVDGGAGLADVGRRHGASRVAHLGAFACERFRVAI